MGKAIRSNRRKTISAAKSAALKKHPLLWYHKAEEKKREIMQKILATPRFATGCDHTEDDVSLDFKNLNFDTESNKNGEFPEIEGLKIRIAALKKKILAKKYKNKIRKIKKIKSIDSDEKLLKSLIREMGKLMRSAKGKKVKKAKEAKKKPPVEGTNLSAFFTVDPKVANKNKIKNKKYKKPIKKHSVRGIVKAKRKQIKKSGDYKNVTNFYPTRRRGRN